MADGAAGSITPFFTIWTEPRATIRRIVDTDPRRNVIALAAIGSAIGALSGQWSKAMGNTANLSALWPIWVAVGRSGRGGDRSRLTIPRRCGFEMVGKPAGRRREQRRNAGGDRVVLGAGNHRRDFPADSCPDGCAGASIGARHVTSYRSLVLQDHDDRRRARDLGIYRRPQVYRRGASILSLARFRRDPDTGGDCGGFDRFHYLRFRSAGATSLIYQSRWTINPRAGAAPGARSAGAHPDCGPPAATRFWFRPARRHARRA